MKLTINHSTRVVDGGIYYLGYLPQYGWSTGPCLTVADVTHRAQSYAEGAEITEVADGIAGRGEMIAALTYAEAAGLRDGGATVRLLTQALVSDLGSDRWLRASRFVVDNYEQIVQYAGKPSVTWVRLANEAEDL